MKKVLFPIVIALLSLSLLSCGLLKDAETEDEASIKINYRADETTRAVASETPSSESSAPSEDYEKETDSEEIPETEPETTREVSTPSASLPERTAGDPLTVCIDAGHGYNDPGCSGENIGSITESEINEEFVQILKEELEAAGHRVILLHTPEHSVTVDEITSAADALGLSYLSEKLEDSERFAPYNRTVWANVLHRSTYIDIFVSVHIDNLPEDDTVRGTRLYYCSDTFHAEKSGSLCYCVADGINGEVTDANAKVFAYSWDDAFAVTKRTDMPSFLIELGFISNKTDAEHILDDSWRHSVAEGMVRGFENYFGE